MPLITVKDLQITKGGVIICDVPMMRVDQGEVVAVVGGNGTGKTTLLRVLAGIESDAHRTCQLAVEPREVVFMHQSPYLFRGSVISNVSYGLRVRGQASSSSNDRARHWLQRCGADHLADQTAAHLSGGERKRVALARALAIEPKVILLDEPLQEVDPDGIEVLCRVLREVAERAAILVTSPSHPPVALGARCVAVGTRPSAPAR